MKYFFSLLRKLLLITSLMLTMSLAIADNEFCWKDSYGRGVGTIPTECANGQGNQAGLCYSACESGFSGVGPVCWSGCPAGYSDNGAMCHIDKALTKNVEWVCTAWLPGWMGGACSLKKTQCPTDYTNVGLFCALNSAGKSPPAGFSGSFLDPMKNSYGRGAGTIPATCPAGQQNDAGLCYSQCQAGYTGIGPVCWAQPPSSWIQCGMGAAKTSLVCAQIVFGQVASVGQLAITIASLGSSTSLTAGMKAPEAAARLTRIQASYTQMKTAFNLAKNNNKGVMLAVAAYDAANVGRKEYKAISTAENAVTEEDMIRMSAQISAIMDPSGISDTVAAYTYPKCSKYLITHDPHIIDIMDPTFYLGKYPDLKAAFGTNVDSAEQHWLTFGIKECRQSSATFSIAAYLNRYPDLQKAFGATNCVAALDHWLQNGKNEKRNAAP